MKNEPTDLSAQAYRHLVHTLTTLLPPPPADTPEAWQARNYAAIAKVADLLPVNANEADLAAQCVAARAQAEDILRLLRHHAGDMHLTIRLNAQYGSMVRTSLAAHGHLLRAQQIRHRREKLTAQIDTDEWTRHIAAREMLDKLDTPAPDTPAVAALPPADMPQAGEIRPNDPESDTESHDAGIEMSVRQPLPRRRPWATHTDPATSQDLPSIGIIPCRTPQAPYPAAVSA